MAKQRYSEEFPSHLLKVPGVLGKMIGWIEACAIRPAPVLALGASIATLSTVMGRWYKGPTGLRANTYVVGLARSGSGKENARACAMTILSRAGLSSLRGSDDLASSAGLLRVLHDHPVRLFCLDEMGLLLGKVTSRQAGTHESDILSVLMRLHSCAPTLWAGKAYAERDSQPIEQPHCCLWGTSTPSRFWDSLSAGHTVDGFLNRLLVLPYDVPIPRSVTPTADPSDPPAELLEVLQAIGSGSLAGLEGNVAGVVTAQTRTVSRAVQQTEGARDEFERMADGQLAKLNTSSCPEAWSRVLEQGMRLALVCAVSLNPENPIITDECARWGARLAWWSVSVTARAAEERVGDTDEQRAQQRILSAIKARGGVLSQRDLTRATQRLDRRFRDAALRTLLDAGMLEEVHDQGMNGRIIKSFQVVADDSVTASVTGQVQ